VAELPSASKGDYAGDITPNEAWERLSAEPGAVLVDVRTDAEFNYVGRPDLSSIGKQTSLISWCLFPTNEINPTFTDDVSNAGIDTNQTVICLCRSGVRSRHSAAALTRVGFTDCYNVLEGFEGDKDSGGHRGSVGGWKVAGLPWEQG
jgi:rhodanese-related sulfurtransferase